MTKTGILRDDITVVDLAGEIKGTSLRASAVAQICLTSNERHMLTDSFPESWYTDIRADRSDEEWEKMCTEERLVRAGKLPGTWRLDPGQDVAGERLRVWNRNHNLHDVLKVDIHPLPISWAEIEAMEPEA